VSELRAVPVCAVHQQSIVIDAVCPLVRDDPEYLNWYQEGGVTALAPTIASTETAQATFERLARWHQLLAQRDDLVLAKTAGDIRSAKATGKTAIYFHFQGADPVEGNLDFIPLYKALGVGVIQLTYNVRNRVGDGCEETSNAGLSRFGRAFINALNQNGVIVDCSHTGLRTSLEAIELSSAPVILSHSNVHALHATARNAPDALIDAIAASGGVIGVVGFPAMISSHPKPDLNDLIAHIDALVQRVGPDHVGLGLDYYIGQHGVADAKAARRKFESMVKAGIWGATYPPPPHYYPRGIETPRSLHNLTARLLERAYTQRDVEKILGGNWLRVMGAVWKGE
jgi:membrane dipeptidase